MMEATVGERPTQPFVEEEEQKRNLDAFCGEAVGITRSVPLQQSDP
jgi:hypothetical protein